MPLLGHLGLAVSLAERLSTTLAPVVEAALPDLIDEPVAEVGNRRRLPYRRPLALAAVVGATALLHRRRGGHWPVAVAVGWCSHLACDLYVAVPDSLADYLWPVTTPVRSAEPVGQYAARYVATHWLATGLLLAAPRSCSCSWLAPGAPRSETPDATPTRRRSPPLRSPPAGAGIRLRASRSPRLV